MLDTKAAGQSPTTHGSYEVSDQCVASRDRHTSDNAATPSLRNSTTSRLHSTRGHSHDTSLPGFSALGHHVTNQAQIDLVMERYLGEKDRYKEFLVGCQDERGHQSQVVALNLKEWNRRWNEITQLRNTHGMLLASSYPESLSLIR